jgi:hypothetical protein
VIPAYYVKLCVWRADTIKNYLQIIDDAVPALKTGGGAHRGHRVQTLEEGSSPAPSGLPEIFYNKEWLASQKIKRPIYVLETLRVSSDQFAFLVACNKGKGKQRATESEADDEDV